MLFGAALFVGFATADMFVRSWTGLLRTVALVVLFLRGRISGETLFLRLNTTVTMTLLCGLTLAAVFLFYYRFYGLGRSELEQIGYFLTATGRTAVYIMGLERRITAMFDPGDLG
jgi:hypothetical protein